MWGGRFLGLLHEAVSDSGPRRVTYGQLFPFSLTAIYPLSALRLHSVHSSPDAFPCNPPVLTCMSTNRQLKNEKCRVDSQSLQGGDTTGRENAVPAAEHASGWYPGRHGMDTPNSSSQSHRAVSNVIAR